MFIGHFAVGFGLKRAAPRTSLGILIASTVWADILWSIFLLLGWEHVRIAPGDTKFTPFDLYDYPWSHSLFMTLVWALGLGLLYRALRRDQAGSWAIALGVISHWILDWLTHRPDMPVYPGGPKLGVHLWNSITGTMTVELLMLTVGVWLYIRTTRARDRIGRWAFWTYVGFLLFIYIADRFGPLPENTRQVAWTGLVGTIVLLLWPWWFDRHRATMQDNPTSAVPASTHM